MEAMNNTRFSNPILRKWNELPEYKQQEFYDFMRDSGYKFINPETRHLDILERQWQEYMEIHKDYRLKSDYVVLEYIGCTNETLYNIIKSALLKDNLYADEAVNPNDILEESAISSNEHFDIAAVINKVLDYPDYALRCEEAEKWMDETGFVMLIPGKDYGNQEMLDKIWEAYNMMIKRHRLMSDWKSLELFKLTTPQIYQYLTSFNMKTSGVDKAMPEDFFSETKFLKRYMKNLVMNESAGAVSEAISRVLMPSTTYEDAIHRGIISAALDMYEDKNNSLNVDINYTDLPAYTPQEMIDMGVFNHAPEENFFGVEGEVLLPGDELLEWFNLYNQVFYGMPPTDRYNELNRKRVNKLTEIYAKDETMYATRRQAILEMGWNPWINYNNAYNRQRADDIINEQIKSNFGSSRIIDLCGFRTINVPDLQINEDGSIGSLLRPIYLVFEEGTTAFSEVIKKVTRGIYSHAAIAFDHTMHKIYSFGVDDSDNGIKGGFCVEDIKNKNPDKQLGIYAIFVDNEIFQKIKNNVEWFIQHAKETAYSYANLLAICFKVPLERTKELICSQFVDRMLKLGGIDITGKKPSMVDPNYLYRTSKSNKAIYKLFEGKNKSYKSKLVSNRVASLLRSSKAVPIAVSESVLTDTAYYHSYVQGLCEMYDRTKKDDLLRRVYDTLYMPCMKAEATTVINPYRDLAYYKDRNYVAEAYEIIENVQNNPNEDMSFSLRVLGEYYKSIEAKTHYNIPNEKYEVLKECLSAIKKVLPA